MINCDTVIVGAGPVGLFQVFELGLLGLDAHVVDAVPHAGGQCIELYPDKPIYDIPAVPVCSGRELIERLQQQIRPFAPQFHLGHTVTSLKHIANGRFSLRTSAGLAFDAGAVIVAGGLGAFAPRTLDLPEAAPLVNRTLHYKVAQPALFDGQDIVIAGGGDAALDWALALVDRVRSLVLVHRSSSFRAAPASVARMHALCDEGRMQLCEGDIVGLETADEALAQVRVRTRSGMVQRIEASHLVVLWGLHPALGPIADWGLALERQQLVVDPSTFQTSVPGVFAVGDINTYPGKKKLILSGFHEAALCAFAAHAHLHPGDKVNLQYTTTSPALQRRLGVREAGRGDAVAQPPPRVAASAA
ncbi:NAD(P)/FAD-dependent oxidoreductase [Rhodanobacter glycinis]|uniref:NAD(P)/FAD-dependent oxidoreductase n=1 Tax=Rhodanobacter glycinis TaxID=582702 RepID=UPI001126832A|nr:NAD(P)/FAD-dependent oxidoreductase [Rhodanobacter glycinis]TPG45638.1 NAD(P)/FAD-dependent oxidoreductase [Rhodanobacter glycinis]